jgi:POT family proton-dependent oligopeptide transporter
MSSEAANPPKKRLPWKAVSIVSTEACERFSYYGMTSILTLYLWKKLLSGEHAEANAKQIVALFTMTVYFMPLLGGFLADRLWGRYRVILYISLFYCLGHGTLALYGHTLNGVCAGLALIAIGAGGIKPNVSAYLGDQFRADQAGSMTRAYGWFYWAVNFGALFGQSLIPALRDHKGYSWAFGIPGIFMGLATLIFWLGRKQYVNVPPAHKSGQPGFLQIVWHCLKTGGASGQKFFDRALGRFTPEEVEGARAVFRILMVFIPIPVFWSLYWQVNTSWVIQGNKMAPYYLLEWMVPFHFYGYKLDGETIQAAGALLVMIWVPVMTLWLYPLAEKLGLRPTPLRRMGLGMILAAAAFVICAWLQSAIERKETFSVLWQLAPYTVLEAGEVLLSATALEFAFAEAPLAMKSTLMSFWYLTFSFGNFLIASFTELNKRVIGAGGVAEFLFYAALMLVATSVFAVLASFYKYRSDARSPATA